MFFHISTNYLIFFKKFGIIWLSENYFFEDAIMKLIQSKVLVIIFSSMLSISLLIGFISVKLLHDKQSESNYENMSNICQIKKEELNNVLTSIEQSVNIISNTSFIIFPPKYL